jgi:hypothetical protein
MQRSSKERSDVGRLVPAILVNWVPCQGVRPQVGVGNARENQGSLGSRGNRVENQGNLEILVEMETT